MENKKKQSCKMLLFFLILTAADQLSKFAASSFLQPLHRMELIPGVLELYYLQNQGAAFGMLKNRQILFIVAAVLMIAAGIYAVLRSPAEKFYSPFRWVVVMIAAGAAGNMIDRVCHQYVIDFLYVSVIDFPVFNVADCYVCIGAAVLAVLLFTCYKEESFSFLKPHSALKGKQKDSKGQEREGQ